MDKALERTLCVVLHYGSDEDTHSCIDSLARIAGLDIIVSDNDPRQSYVPSRDHEQFVRVIKTGGKAGFSEGNNMAVNTFLSDVHHAIFILNNDTIVTDGAVDLLRNTLASACVGAVGPCMPYADNPKRVWACGGSINRLTLNIGGDQPRDCFPYEADYLPGAAILCRADLWKEIGGFNENYFLAYEEAEFCLEVKSKGFKIMADPQAIVLHRVGMSSQQKPEYFYNSIRNRLLFARYIYGRNAGFVYGVIVTLLSVKGRSVQSLFLRICLWFKAMHDDIAGIPISHDIFNAVSRSFASYSE